MVWFSAKQSQVTDGLTALCSCPEAGHVCKRYFRSITPARNGCCRLSLKAKLRNCLHFCVRLQSMPAKLQRNEHESIATLGAEVPLWVRGVQRKRFVGNGTYPAIAQSCFLVGLVIHRGLP